jgi:hypothetical protein
MGETLKLNPLTALSDSDGSCINANQTHHGFRSGYTHVTRSSVGNTGKRHIRNMIKYIRGVVVTKILRSICNAIQDLGL